ncbi:MAG: hypothetical protein OEV42_14570 [Deltaproteobacteria bacterium]|nr:hypothetical protein [Deltaproteobacteria bacterium]
MKQTLLYFSLILFALSLTINPSTLYGSSEYEKWKKEELGSFRDFKEKRDKDFTAYLKKQWEEFRLFKGEKAYKKPKIKKIPIAPKIKPSELKPFGGKAVKIMPLPQKTPKAKIRPHKKTEPDIVGIEPSKLKIPEKKAETIPQKKEPQVKIVPLDDKEGEEVPQSVAPKKATPAVAALPESRPSGAGKKIGFDFYGSIISLMYDESMKMAPMRKVNAKAISNFWENQSKADYENLLGQLKDHKEKLSLNDWGYHLLTYNTGKKIFGKRDKNNIKLFAWFILSKSGYESKIGYNSNDVFLLIPSKNSLYGVSFLNINGRKYYALSFDGKLTRMSSIFTYRAKYPGSDELMDYGIYKTPEIVKKVHKKELKFNYRGKAYTVPVEYNKTVADFFEYYPQTEFEVYFNASASPEAGYSMLKGLRPIVKGKTEGEAVNIIMRFVQTAFKYKTDNGQFGREKYLLPDETLYYPYSDCEDRSILFAYLVRNLLGLEVVGLHYPGHMATAVRFKDSIKGDSVTYRGKKYIVCDPTYVNADIGVAMPRYRKVNPKVIPIGV